MLLHFSYFSSGFVLLFEQLFFGSLKSYLIRSARVIANKEIGEVWLKVKRLSLLKEPIFGRRSHWWIWREK